MIAVSKKGKGTPKNSTTQSSHLVLTNQKKPNLMLNKNDTNSMPHTPNKSSKQGIFTKLADFLFKLWFLNIPITIGMPNSISFECDLNNKEALTLKNPNQSSSPFLQNNNENMKNTPNLLNKPHLSTNLQKYYSFQKSSYSLSENKCTCFNMPFVCEICTTR